MSIAKKDGTGSCTAGKKIECEHPPSPQHHDFNKAKQCVVGTFKNIGTLIAELDKTFSDFTAKRPDLVPIFEKYNTKKGWFLECQQFFEKEKMKAVIFGSTSSGKSTTINAILHKRLLVTGIGHVTNCIFQIEGSKETEKMCVRKDKDEKELIEDLEEYLERKFPEGKELQTKSTLYVTCPTSQFTTLKKDVILFDCPGLDKTTEHDSIIYNHCKDADVFVFVSDAKSTIRKAEVSFFEKIEDPTVFILFNCWDLSEKNDYERKRARKVRDQHSKDAYDFLKRSNKHLKENDFKDKIYFVSAEESLETYEHPKDKTDNLPGRDQRHDDFLKFEKTFWKYTTDSALQTRFKSRVATAKQQLEDLKEKVEQINDKLRKKREECDKILGDLKNIPCEEMIKTRQKETLKEILKLMEIESIKACAEKYREEMKPKGDNETWNRYLKVLHTSVITDIKKKMKEILQQFRENTDEKNRMEIERCLKDIRLSNETQNGTERHQECVSQWEFDEPKEAKTEYTWSFGPYTLVKKYIWYRSNHQNQSTTTPGRAFLQTGGVGTAVLGCAIAAATPFTLPIIGTSAALGTAFSFLHYIYDKLNWTEESKLKYIQKLCAANIHFQFTSKYAPKLLKILEELDIELLECFKKRLDSCTDDKVDMYSNIQIVLANMEKTNASDVISNAKKELDMFEMTYLRQDNEWMG